MAGEYATCLQGQYPLHSKVQSGIPMFRNLTNSELLNTSVNAHLNVVLTLKGSLY